MVQLDYCFFVLSIARYEEDMLISGNSTDVRLISPVKEIAAYESLWEKYSSFHQLANLFRESNHALPSEIALQQKITDEEITSVKSKLRDLLPY
jgi:hypothetical protein